MTVASDWRFLPRAEAKRKEPLKLPEPFFNRNKDPDGYDPGEALIAAVNVALLLGQPLLLTGEPGCGKTSLAYWLAAQLGLAQPLVQVVKSTTSGKDLLYRFDELSRFRDAYGGPTSKRPNEDYIEFEALGRAILFSAGPDGEVIPDVARGPTSVDKPRYNRDVHRDPFPDADRQVVLIDELDKAPRDTPNDLLSEIERMEFRIPELGVTVRGDPQRRPVVIITSNSDKSLPEPFLRRCVYHHIPTPDADRRAAIVAKRTHPLAKRPELMADAMDTFETVRARIGARGRPPGTAELLAWLDVVAALFPTDAHALNDRRDLLQNSLSALAKTKDDLTLVREILQFPA